MSNESTDPDDLKIFSDSNADTPSSPTGNTESHDTAMLIIKSKEAALDKVVAATQLTESTIVVQSVINDDASTIDDTVETPGDTLGTTIVCESISLLDETSKEVANDLEDHHSTAAVDNSQQVLATITEITTETKELTISNDSVDDSDSAKHENIERNNTTIDGVRHEQQASQNTSRATNNETINNATTTKRKAPGFDPYAGYDNPPPRKNKRARKKRNHAAQAPTDQSESFNDVVVRYTEDGLPNDLVKYYNQRYSYFSRYDQGILMDREGWFSVTPERIAQHIAERCRCDTIVDAFTGCGGNAIQFAFTCERVIAIDVDPVKLHCARHNARIYGVEDRIEFIQADFFEIAPKLKADAIFLSPPWGGPSYQQSSVFDITTMIPGNGANIYSIASKISPHVAYFVPRNTDPQQLARLAGPNGVCEIEQNYLRGNLKALTVYYGDLVNRDYLEQL